MRSEPKNQLQKEVHDRYQKGKSIAKKMALVSPSTLCKKYSVSSSTIRLCLSGGNPIYMTKAETKKAAREYKKYRELREELEPYTVKAIAEEFGINKKTVYEWGNGRFGKIDKPDSAVISLPKTMRSDPVASFLTMKLSKNPKPGFYY